MINPKRLIFEIKCKDRKDCWCFALIFTFPALFRSEKCNFAHESEHFLIQDLIFKDLRIQEERNRKKDLNINALKGQPIKAKGK